MSHQCPFPVRATDTRRCYRTGSVPGFTLSLTLVAILSGYAGLSDAAPVVKSKTSNASSSVTSRFHRRLCQGPRARGPSCRPVRQGVRKALKSQNAKSKGRFKQANIHVVELPAGADEVVAMQSTEEGQAVQVCRTRLCAMAPAASVNDPSYSKSWALPKLQRAHRLGYRQWQRRHHRHSRQWPGRQPPGPESQLRSRLEHLRQQLQHQ
jgi:thermitase